MTLALSDEDLEAITLPPSTAGTTEVLESPTEVLGPALTTEQRESLEGHRKRSERPVEGLRKEQPQKRHKALGESLAEAQYDADLAIRETWRIMKQVEATENNQGAGPRSGGISRRW